VCGRELRVELTGALERRIGIVRSADIARLESASAVGKAAQIFLVSVGRPSAQADHRGQLVGLITVLSERAIAIAICSWMR